MRVSCFHHLIGCNLSYSTMTILLGKLLHPEDRVGRFVSLLSNEAVLNIF